MGRDMRRDVDAVEADEDFLAGFDRFEKDSSVDFCGGSIAKRVAVG